MSLNDTPLETQLTEKEICVRDGENFVSNLGLLHKFFFDVPDGDQHFYIFWYDHHS
jgi:hypothetical protein